MVKRHVRRRSSLITFAVGAVLFAVQVSAQDAPRIGFLSALSYDAFPSRIDAFRQGLKDLGYIEGKNILVEYRWADGRPERLAALAAELEQLKVAVIVSAGPSATRPARQATKSTPIVMGFDSDPVGSGFVDSLARPGGRITGLSFLAPEISAKQVDVLRQIIPGLVRIAVLGDSKEPGNARGLEEAKRAADALGLQARAIDMRAARNVAAAFAAARHGGAQAIVLLPSPLFAPDTAAEFVRAAAAERLPAMYWNGSIVERGGLLSYSANMDDLFRRAAIYVDKILKGAKPGELPVEQPYKFDLIVNVKAAKEIGLVIPMSVLSRADRVIQ